MLFTLKKFVSFWLMPVPACLLLIAIGWGLVRWTKRRRLGRALQIAGAALLLLFGNKYVSSALVRPLEAHYAAIPELRAGEPVPPALAACRYIVVLGSGHGHTPGLAATTMLSTAALGRLTEAVRLMRVLPDAKLIVSGPADNDHETHASVLARAAESLGVARERILLITDGHDTEEEAAATAKIARGAPVAVITSAWHLPRAVALFRHMGLAPLPVPCDYAWHTNGDFRWEEAIWDRESIDRSTRAVHEYIGYTWIWLRGKT
ncbi:MAG: hypothetical protein RLZZ15_199 [Verrucomicrobiota bacterium]